MPYKDSYIYDSMGPIDSDLAESIVYYSNGGIIDRVKNNLIDPLKEDIKSGNPLDWLDIPQKLMVYSATSLSRLPFEGLAAGGYKKPSEVMRDWGANEKTISLQGAADIVMDPLNFIPLEKLKYLKKINLLKNGKGGTVNVLQNSGAKWRNIGRHITEGVDSTQDLYEIHNENNKEMSDALSYYFDETGSESKQSTRDGKIINQNVPYYFNNDSVLSNIDKMKALDYYK